MAEKNRTSEEFKVPLRWEIPDDMDILWASNFTAQHSTREFILTFFQVSPPILLEPTQEAIDAIAREGLRAKAVARIALTPAALKELINVLQTNLDTFLKNTDEGMGQE